MMSPGQNRQTDAPASAYPYVLLITAALAIVTTIFCLQAGITNVFPHLYYLPIVLAAYWYPRRGVSFALVMAVTYCALVLLLGYTDVASLITAVIRAAVFIGIAAVVAYLAGRLQNDMKEYRALFESTGTAMMLVGRDGIVARINGELVRMLGYSRDAAAGTIRWEELVAPDGREAVGALLAIRDQQSGTAPSSFEMRALKKDGTIFDAMMTVAPAPTMGGYIISLVDISERKQAEVALKASETRLRTTLDSLQAGVVIIEEETHRITDVNPAAEKMIGAAREEIIGHVCHRFICPAEEGSCPITNLGQRVDCSERVVVNLQGEKIPVIKTVAQMTIDGRAYLVENFVDIRDRKEAEQALLAYVTEAALRLKQPVELIRDNLADILQQVHDGETAREIVETEIKVQIMNADRIVDNLRDLDCAIAQERKEIPEAFRAFLSR